MRKNSFLYWIVPMAMFVLPMLLFCITDGAGGHSRDLHIIPLHEAWPKVFMYRYRYPFPGLVYIAILASLVAMWFRKPHPAWAVLLLCACAVLGPTGNILALFGL